MAKNQTLIGRFEYNIAEVADEYRTIAEEDEQAALLLISKGKYRNSVYFLVQAMEKFVRATILGLVNPHTGYFQDRTRTHNLDDLLDFLVEIISSNSTVQEQVRYQLHSFVLGGIRFGKMHNDLRYPQYSVRYKSYSMLRITAEDADFALQRLQTLKQFLRDIQKLAQ